MKAREMANLGVPKAAMKAAQEVARRASEATLGRHALRSLIAAVVEDPAGHRVHAVGAPLAEALLERAASPVPVHEFRPRDAPAPWRQWGDDIDAASIEQMANACALPVAVRGALMPDAHLGYGLPIGGVLATKDAVIPYAVGVDIACRMKMTVLDLPRTAIEGQTDRLANAIEAETRFGIGASFAEPNEHPVLDADWRRDPVTERVRDKARAQLGSSGSGNHFVEFGTLTVEARHDGLGLDAGTYVALLSHSGSRGAGAAVASHYSKLAQSIHPDLPKHLRHLAWLDLDTEEGRGYWDAMSLMGEYAEANHAIIHRRIARHLRADVLADVENHHNFAWKEVHDGAEVVVHRKGATPAHAGAIGIIPGSMASPAYVVVGKGSPDALESASHGAGRVMSRTVAKRSFTWSEVKRLLAERGVRVLSAGLDEVPGVYKDIDTVMRQQHDLVEPIARFDPKIVKMAPPGERAED